MTFLVYKLINPCFVGIHFWIYLSIQNDTFIFSFTDPCFVGVSYNQKRLDLVLLDECIPLGSIAWLHFIVSMETV